MSQTLPGDDNVIVLQLLSPGSPGGPVVEPQLQTNSLVEMSVQLLNPVSNEAGGAHDQGRPPPASPLGRKLGRSDREDLRLGRMLHCTGHWGRDCWFAWLSDQRCQETLGKRIDAVAGHLLLPGPLDSLRPCGERCCIVLEKFYYSPMPRL